jgi:hypothetical protein
VMQVIASKFVMKVWDASGPEMNKFKKYRVMAKIHPPMLSGESKNRGFHKAPYAFCESKNRGFTK